MKQGEPERWLARPDQAPPGAVELLRAAQLPSPPSPELRARLGTELHRLASAPPLHSIRWPFLSGVAVVAVGAAGWLALSPAHAPARFVASPAPAALHASVRVAVARAPAEAPVAAAPSPAAPRERPAPSVPAARLAAPRRAAVRPAVVRAEPHASRLAAPKVAAGSPSEAASDSLAREAALIEAARRTVHARPVEALRTLELHRHEFPDGQLGAEREFLAVSALVQLGRYPEAEGRGRALVAQYPGTTYAQRVPALLAR